LSEVSLLSKKDSTALKGFAILLVIIHHLFVARPDYSIDLFGTNILLKLAMVAKVSVAIFIMLSAYGLSESCKNKENDLGDFYFKRLTKLYFTYWIVFIISLVIGTFFFDRTLASVYGNDLIYNMITEFLGVQMFTFGYGYNATWWFMSLIIPLYILFPFLYSLTKTFKWIMLIAGYFIMMSTLLINSFGWLNVYIMPFILGIFLSLSVSDNAKKRWSNLLLHNFFVQALLVVCIIGVTIQRFRYVRHADVYVDYALSFLLILFVWIFITKMKYLHAFLEKIGKVSFEMFLVHTFFHYYFFTDLIYSSKNPFVVFALMVLLSYITSWLLQKLITFIYERGVKSILPKNINTKIKF